MDVAQDGAVKLATGKQAALVKVKPATFCSLLRLLSLSASALLNADVFISPLFPPAVMPLMGIIRLPDIS